MTKQTKEIERTVKEMVTKFIADDGTEFNSENECKLYEESAAFAIKTRIKDVLQRLDDKAVYHNGLDAILDDWRCEADYYAIKFENEEQIKDFIALCKANKWELGNNGDWSENNAERLKYYFAERFKDLKVGVQYVLLVHENEWGAIASKEKLLECIEHGFDSLFDKAE